MITFFSFVAASWFLSQGVAVFASNSLEDYLMMIDGIVNVIIGVGFSLAAKWSWTLRAILSIVLMIEGTLSLLGLVIDGGLFLSENSEFTTFAIGALIINPLILYYLYRPHVKAYFGKVVTVKSLS
jgi:hypothetical protein